MAKKNAKATIITEATAWFSDQRPLFDHLARKLESTIRDIITDHKIQIHSIHSRTKDISSFSKKIAGSKYTNPKDQVTDLCGIRIISYVESDLEKICHLIEKAFDIDKKNSGDKSTDLGTDKVGYRSIHYVAKLSAARLKLEEFKKFSGLRFEIQIRTILQHAWAEIEHDRNYKFSGKLPQPLQRRLKLLAGLLELADREFNSIASEIDRYSDKVTSSTKSRKNLEIPIDSTSLKTYLRTRFATAIEKGLQPHLYNQEYEKVILQELDNFGIKNLNQLDKIITHDFQSIWIAHASFSQHNPETFVGLLRDIMMINDIKKYFTFCWKKSWSGIEEDTIDLLEQYNVPIRDYVKKYRLDIVNDDILSNDM